MIASSNGESQRRASRSESQKAAQDKPRCDLYCSSCEAPYLIIALSTDGLEWEAARIIGGEKVLSRSAAVNTYSSDIIEV